MVKTGDTQAPIWPSGEPELNLSENGQTATVNWPEAIDDGVLAGYSITVDGWRDATEPPRRDNTLRSLGRGHFVAVSAEDEAGTRVVPCPQPCPFSTRSSGVTNAFASWSSTQETATLTWSCPDNVGVVGYRVIPTGKWWGNPRP